MSGPRLLLLHLTFVGAGAVSTGIEFGPNVTIIRGPSDTGKSFIVDAIDYMLGASKLRYIPQLGGFTHVLLGVVLPDGRIVTLSRALAGGAFSLYGADYRDIPAGVDAIELAASHNAKSKTNLSNFLLGEIGLENKLLRKNVNNAKVSLSFRDVAHLSVIDETRMQDATPPGLSGRPTDITKEISALKLFLEGQDDSALAEVVSPRERKKLGEAQSQVIDRMLDALRPKLEGEPEPEQLREQRLRLQSSLDDLSKSIKEATYNRSVIARSLAGEQRALSIVRERSRETHSLVARFSLLRDQYTSDLERLEMVAEAGSLLGYFAPGACPFCGAEEEHQHVELAHGEVGNQFRTVVEAEAKKTSALSADLDATTRDLELQLAAMSERAIGLRASIEELEEALRNAEISLLPVDQTLGDYLKAMSGVDNLLVTHERVQELELLQLEIAEEAKAVKATAAEGISLGAVNEFSVRLRSRLGAWGYPDAEQIRYDRGEQDIVDGDQLRSAHGKGVRAVLHAAFTVALADFCFERSLPHPGFVVIDSPLVTYRPPKSNENSESLRDDRLDPSVIGKFYRNLQDDFAGQLIILENTDPPDAPDPKTHDLEFTKQLGVGRYGLF